jgi:acyl-CoA-binding protein
VNTLSTTAKYLVRESVDEVIDLIRQFISETEGVSGSKKPSGYFDISSRLVYNHWCGLARTGALLRPRALNLQ